jgi:hypothetical protein
LPLLLVRKANRSRQGWQLLLPLLGLYLVLAFVERELNGYLIFHYHQYICSVFADFFRFFALGLAILLAIGDRLKIPLRLLRFALLFMFLFLAGNVQIAVNAWPWLDSGKWSLIFGIMLVVFMIGNSIAKAALRRLVTPGKFLTFYTGLCAVIGVVPLLVLGAAEAVMNRSGQLQSTQEAFRIIVVLATAISVPYAVYSAFLMLACLNSVYRQRFEAVFGLKPLAQQADPAREPESSCPAR